MSAWLEALLGRVFNSGVSIPLSKGINFTGGIAAALNPTTKQIDVTFDGEVAEGTPGEPGEPGEPGPPGEDGADGEVNLGHAPFSALNISSNTISIDTSAGGIFAVTLTADVTTVTMANVVASEANFFTLRVKQDGTGGRAFTPPASWKFATGAYVVSSAANATDLLQGITYDDGTTWQVSYLRSFV